MMAKQKMIMVERHTEICGRRAGLIQHPSEIGNQTRRLSGRKGLITLEAALLLPPVLLMLFFGLLSMRHEYQLLILGDALDQTAAEIALLLPVKQAGQQLMVGQFDIDFDDLLLSIGSGVLERAQTVALEVFVEHRLSIWLDKAIKQIDRSSESAIIRPPAAQDFADRTIDIKLDRDHQVLWIQCEWQRTILGVPIQSMLRTAVPVWSIAASIDKSKEPLAGDASKNSVWLLDNFSRGQTLRSLFSANLPYDFPVLSRWIDGEATVIHTIDLTAPTYQATGEVRSAIREKLYDLRDFDGAIYERDGESLAVAPHQIQSRRLVLVVPQNYDRERLDFVLTDMSQTAQTEGIVLQLETYGVSTRYSESHVTQASEALS